MPPPHGQVRWPGVQADSWESVATSWILPDFLHVVWRVMLVAATAALFATGVQASHTSLNLFSVDAYRMAVANASVLLMPCVLSIVWSDAGMLLEGQLAQCMWFCVAAFTLFATAFVVSVTAGYFFVVRLTWFEADGRHALLAAWLLAEVVLGGVQTGALHYLVGACAWSGYVGGVVFGWWGSLWMHAAMRLNRKVGAFVAIVTYLLVAGALVGLMKARLWVANRLQRRRDDAVLKTGNGCEADRCAVDGELNV